MRVAHVSAIQLAEQRLVLRAEAPQYVHGQTEVALRRQISDGGGRGVEGIAAGALACGWKRREGRGGNGKGADDNGEDRCEHIPSCV